ncbi:MAG: hypothetical protein FWE84_01590 [Firmicutes bacterium]|nr:hypothetical protein [Bacillota bacterium]
MNMLGFAIFGLEISGDVLIATIVGGLIAGYFGILFRNKETRNRASESFIKNKITAYEEIRKFCACFFERDFAGIKDTCCIRKEFKNNDLEISFSKVLACREKLDKRSVEIHCYIILKHQFFIERKLLKKLLSLREALFRLSNLYKSDDYINNFDNDVRVAFMATQEIVILCNQIYRDVFHFYNRPIFLRFGKLVSEKEEIKNKLKESKFWGKSDSTVAYLCRKEKTDGEAYKYALADWNNKAYRNRFNKDNDALICKDICKCEDSCWEKKKREYSAGIVEFRVKTARDEEEEKLAIEQLTREKLAKEVEKLAQEVEKLTKENPNQNT